MAKTKIEWADRVWNPVTGCTKISPGCANCYAERMSHRFGEKWGLPKNDPFKVTLHSERLEQPLRWTKPSRVFVCSMSDLFHDDVPFEFVHEIWDVMKACSQHTFLVLTKRPQKMKEVLERIYSLQRFGWAKGFWNHVWLGVTAENQEQADKRIQILLQIPAVKRFVSVEPMLGSVRLDRLGQDKSYCIDALSGRFESNDPISLNPEPIQEISKLDWVICGGESGPGARPMHPDWVYSLRDQCQSSNTSFMFKQFGEWTHDLTMYDGAKLKPEQTHWIWPNGKHLQVGFGEVSPGKVLTYRVGKKKAGRLLNGQLWNQYPG